MENFAHLGFSLCMLWVVAVGFKMTFAPIRNK